MAAGRPTLDDVARAAGVSRMTVSNAYNRPDQLSVVTRERVLDAARSLGYAGPDPAARSLRRGRAGAVGVLLTERLPYAFGDPGMVEFLHGVATRLSDAGQGLLLVPTLVEDGPALVGGSMVDAFVVCSLPADDPAVEAVRARRLPMVTVGGPRLRGVPFLGIDNEGAGRAMARHLLELGHERFGVVSLTGTTEHPRTGPLRAGCRARADAFVAEVVATLGEHGVVRVAEAETNDRQAGRLAAAELLTGSRGRPTAVFAVTDVLAMGVLDQAHALGLDVPARLSVAGFDDIDEAARADPPLTTVRQRLFEQGRLAAGIALDLVDGRTPSVPRLGTKLVVRETTGPPPRPRRVLPPTDR